VCLIVRDSFDDDRYEYIKHDDRHQQMSILPL